MSPGVLCPQRGRAPTLLPSLPLSRDRRDRHRSKSRDGSRGDKSVTIQAPGEPLLDNESTRGDERVRMGRGLPWGLPGFTSPPSLLQKGAGAGPARRAAPNQSQPRWRGPSPRWGWELGKGMTPRAPKGAAEGGSCGGVPACLARPLGAVELVGLALGRLTAPRGTASVCPRRGRGGQTKGDGEGDGAVVVWACSWGGRGVPAAPCPLPRVETAFGIGSLGICSLRIRSCSLLSACGATPARPCQGLITPAPSLGGSNG